MAPEKESHRRAKISRRSFLGRAAATAASFPVIGALGCGKESEPGEPACQLITPSGYGYQQWSEIYETIIRGFIRNALRTSDTFAVCDYQAGTFLKNFITGQGKTCDSVTRILPALAAGIVSPDGAKEVSVEDSTFSLAEIFLSALRHGTDPASNDFWGYARPADWDQRQVESSIVAFSLWLTADILMDKLTPAERRNIQSWLASCTRFTGHGNNWDLFTAVNQAARLALSGRWPEFAGDEEAFRGDLAMIDKMYAGDGWYHDSVDGQEYDYYNFWVFASHNLYWDMMVGEKFPELRDSFRKKLTRFLSTTPFFYGAQGSHILFGRSLIYHFGTLTPLVLSYRLGLWPYSVGLLRRICNKNLSFFWQAGAWDAYNSKLRETLTPHSSRAVCESYINNGHPYWGMQAFHAMSFARDDPFWQAEEEPLPVEKQSFSKGIAAPGILLYGHKESGQVQMWQARTTKHYPNKYYNFSYSSHFPFNVEMVDNLVPPDNILSFESSVGAYARRDGPYKGWIKSINQLFWYWKTVLGETEVDIASTVYIDSEFQWRAHRVKFAGDQPLTAVESTYALGLGLDEQPEVKSGGLWEHGRSAASGCAVFVRGIAGFTGGRKLSGFRNRENLNIFYPRALQAGVAAELGPGEHALAAVLYASPKPLPLEELLARTENVPEEITAFLKKQEIS